MKLATVEKSSIAEPLRFDSKYHIARRNPLLQQLRSDRWSFSTIGELFGVDNVWTGNIFARVYAETAEYGKPLLVPYDLFRYLPWSDKILSRSQVSQFERLEIRRGWLFIVCSGRNLGPVTMADQFCEGFAMSHDMVRIAVEPSDTLFYVAAFLTSSHGQASIRTDMNGSVIDHTDENLVSQIRVPLVNDALRTQCANLFREGFEKREEARLTLARASAAFLERLGIPRNADALSPKVRVRRFGVFRSTLSDRLDAEPAAPVYAAWREAIRATGGVRLSEIARVFKPASRYKTIYVEDEAHGMRMLNGRQIAQYRPIATKYMSRAAFKGLSSFSLEPGTTLLTADGRAEENLADCALVTAERKGWGASGHVHRVVPHSGILPGLVYLACSSQPVQAQLKALATGSVVDALSEADVSSVLVPFGNSDELHELAADAETAWQLFADGIQAEDKAVGMLEAELAS